MRNGLQVRNDTGTVQSVYMGSQPEAHGLRVAATCPCICPPCRRAPSEKLTVLGIHDDGKVRMLHHTRPASLTIGHYVPCSDWTEYRVRLVAPAYDPVVPKDAQGRVVLKAVAAASMELLGECAVTLTRSIRPRIGWTPDATEQCWTLTAHVQCPNGAAAALTEFHQLLAGCPRVQVSVVSLLGTDQPSNSRAALEEVS